jgi:hypothetical protein
VGESEPDLVGDRRRRVRGAVGSRRRRQRGRDPVRERRRRPARSSTPPMFPLLRLVRIAPSTARPRLAPKLRAV